MKVKEIIIEGFTTRQELAKNLNLSERELYDYLNDPYFEDKIPKRCRLSPAHQKIIYAYAGLKVSE